MKNKYKSSFYNIYRCNCEIFNSFSKADAFFDNEMFNYIKEEKLENISYKDIQKLLELGFIVPIKVDEFQIIKENYMNYHKKKETLLITLVPTFMCNFRCKYCFEGSTSKENRKIIDYNVLKKYAKNNFNKFKHIHITLFGGEPLLCCNKNLDFFKYLKKLCKENSQTYSSSIATNAYLLNDSYIDDLINVCNCQTFQITIDGCKKTHNKLRSLANGTPTYDVVVRNFKKLLKYNDNNNLNIVLRVNLFNNDIDEVNTLLEEFSEEEKSKFSIYFRYIYNTKEFKEENQNKINLNEFHTNARNKGFTINGNKSFSFYHCEGDGEEEQIHILPDLKVYKCINDMSYDKSFVGEINSEGKITFNDNIHIWNDNSFFDDAKCHNCKYLPMCWGGCPLIHKKTGKRICIYEKVMDERNERKERV